MRTVVRGGQAGVLFATGLRPGWDCEKCPVAQSRFTKVAELIAQLKPLANQDTLGRWEQNFFVTEQILAEEPACSVFSEYTQALEQIDEAENVCRHNSEEIFRDGAAIGLYCPSADEELFY